MVVVKWGYYSAGDVWFYLGAEPPAGQYVFRDGAWVPLPDPFYLMDKIIDGDPDVDGPFPDPPKGVPAVRLARLTRT
jgi:hypothetical protein